MIVLKGPMNWDFARSFWGQTDEVDEFQENDLEFLQGRTVQNIKSLAGKNQDGVYLKDSALLGLLVLSTSLNHWLAGSHVLSLFKHLQVFVTMVLLGSTSKQTVSLPTVDERCILESEIMSHFELGSVQIILSLAGLPNPSACKQK